MASANLDLVRSIFAAWERGDFSSVEWAHPEIEYVNAGGPSPGSWTGLAEIAEGMRDFLSAWEQWHAEADDYRELDDERLLVLSHYSGRGKTSGLELGQMWARGAQLFHVRGGKVARIVSYWDREGDPGAVQAGQRRVARVRRSVRARGRADHDPGLAPARHGRCRPVLQYLMSNWTPNHAADSGSTRPASWAVCRPPRRAPAFTRMR